MVADCYECLNSLATTDQGRVVMCSDSTIAVLCQAITTHSVANDKAVVLLDYLLTSSSLELTDTSLDAINDLLTKAIHQLLQPKDPEIFTILHNLYHIVSAIPQRYFHVDKTLPVGVVVQLDWLNDVRTVLYKILQSRLADEQRAPAVHLCAALISKLGSDWLISDVSQSQFFFLLVHLVVVEIRMILEDKTTAEIVDKLSLLSSCYIIIESTLLLIGNSIFDDKQCDLLMMALTDAFNVVLSFLRSLQHPQTTDKLISLVSASMRVLGSWLVNEQLPVDLDHLEYILSLCKTYTDNQTTAHLQQLSLTSDPMEQSSGQVREFNGDILQFILPGLSHLSVIDETRHVIISKKFHWLLIEYLQDLWTKLTSNINADSVKVTIATVCGILLNIVVMETKLVQEDRKFTELLHFLVMASVTLSSKELVLTYNFITLCLLLIKSGLHLNDVKTGQLFDLIMNCLHGMFIIQQTDTSLLTLTLSYQQAWGDIEELITLAIQVLADMISTTTCLEQQLTVIMTLFIKLIQQLNECQAIEARCRDVLTAYNALLISLCKQLPHIRQTLNNSGGLIVARKLKLIDMEKILQ